MKISKSLLVKINHAYVVAGILNFSFCLLYSTAPLYDKLLINLIFLEAVCVVSYVASLLINVWEEDTYRQADKEF
jgi:hypothetical protein